MHRKPKVSHGRLVRVGLVGPNGVADGHQVDIPEPIIYRYQKRRDAGGYACKRSEVLVGTCSQTG